MIQVVLYILYIFCGDIEQLNTLDKVILEEDESSFATIPSSKPRRHPISEFERHVRQSPYCHGNHRCHHSHGHSHDHGFSHHSRLHKPHKKDPFGHHIFHKHFTNRNNVSPMKEIYVPFYTYHYPGFPFKDSRDEVSNVSEEEDDDDDNEFEQATFH